jgi:hypothetical protein
MTEASMTLAPKRRWSFSLRTLFVVVTVLGVSLVAFQRYCREHHLFYELRVPTPEMTPTDARARWGEPERVAIIDGDEVWYYARENAYLSFRHGKCRASNIFYEVGPWWLNSP